jgi:hypothetical protein
MNTLSSEGMLEGQFPGMQVMPLRTAPAAILRVACHGMPEVFQVNTNLVRPARSRSTFDECFSVAVGKHSIVGEGIPPAIDDRHFLAVHGMSADGRIDLAVGHAWNPIGKG